MIRFEQVTKRFGAKTVLDGISYEIRRGETFVIVGRSGAGKSVSLRHMIRLLTPDAGRVWVGDDCVSEASGKQLERILGRYGVLFQSAALLQWLNVEDNVCLPLRQTMNLPDDEVRARAAEKLAMVGLEGVGDKMPADISGGMRKRVGLARAIVTQPEIILYDEPTSGLDPVISRQIDLLIDDLRQRLGVTSVVVTHDLYSALYVGTRVAMLHEGRFAVCAPPEEFVASEHPVVRDFLQAQGIAGMDDVRKAFGK
ncbi:MAG: ATP-binding cassette domain-containing protein [Opitutae bacterium]|jgi:phospholipid/cholesterol/gamma-HCH transport system ATP-binding protein|nr:ATP-binding cassette domain-containing protein [Kiritimatiellia bacterium]NCC92343.1 ATP-binding cassette domain-containing protein [Opitutae bacterium]